MTNPAETYERSIVPYLFRPWALALLERVAPQPGERVLDVACGTGIVAREAVKHVGPDGRVTGVDFSAPMLAVAEQQAASEGVSVDWHEAEASTLPFGDGEFDVVLCQQGLQFVPDRAAAVREMHRVLAPGGRAAVSVWREIELHPFFRALDEVIRAHAGIPAAAAPFAFADAEALRGLLTEAAFADVQVDQPSMTARYPEPERNLYETVHALVAVAPALQALSEDEREALIREVCGQMEEVHRSSVQGEHVVLDWHANVAVARRAA